MKLACFGLLLSSLASAVNGQNIVEVIGNNTELSTLSGAIALSGLAGVASTTELTVFAPTDEAFGALEPDVLTALQLPEYKYHLEALLYAHTVPGTLLSSNITDGATVDSFNGPLTFSVNDQGVFVSGGGFNLSQVIEADDEASNGVVHVVDQVFLPTNLVQTTWQNLLDVPEGFDVLKEYLEATNLYEALESPEALTIFAPSDDVFAGVSQETLDTLNMTEVLLNHALVGLYPTNLLTNGLQVRTALGLNYTITVDGDSYFIEGIPVVLPNLVSMNGIVHVISGLLLPPVEGEAPVAPPVLAPTEGESAPTMAPGVGGESTPTLAPGSTEGPAASSAAMVGTFMTMAAMIATTLLW